MVIIEEGNVMKKEVSLICVLLLVASSFVFGADGVLPGSGTEADPYLIEDLADFDSFTNDPNMWSEGVFTRLEVAVDLSPALSNRQVYNMAPIAGDPQNDLSFDGIQYSGCFDGGGNVVSNLTIRGNYYCGLFGYVGQNGKVENLGIENATVVGTGRFVGALAGEVEGGAVENCFSKGSVEGDRYVGGLVGYVFTGDVYRSSSECDVTGKNYVGGLVGGVNNQEVRDIHQCFATGRIVGQEGVGGISGFVRSANVSSCYTNIDINAIGSLGGLLGSADPYTIIKSCYSVGVVRGESSSGGLIGGGGGFALLNSYSACIVKGVGQALFYDNGISNYQVSDCYYYKYAGANNSYGVSLIDEQLLDISSFDKFDFVGNDEDGIENVWIYEQGKMPKLSWQTTPAFGAPYFLDSIETSLTGSGYPDDPFLINSLDDLLEFRSNSNMFVGHYRLTKDIELLDVKYSGAFINSYFSGTFDGSSNVISGLSLDGDNRIGFFNILLSGGLIKNLVINNVSITATGDYVGGIVGGNAGTVSHCTISGNISGDASVGGVSGFSSGIVTSCKVEGEIYGDDDVGGLVGKSISGTISNSFSSGNIVGSERVGGLVGNLSETEIINCYSHSTVTGSTYVGGLVGQNGNIPYRVTPGVLYNCYATGKVTNGGGLFGDNQGSVYNCFWDIDSTGTNRCKSSYGDCPSGAIGKTTAEMKDVMTYINAGWNFSSTPEMSMVWKKTTYGYPRLVWEDVVLSPDLSNDGVIDFYDFAIISYYWLMQDCMVTDNCDGADIDLSNNVGVEDLNAVLNNWLNCFLVGYWQLDEIDVALDSSKFGRDGTVYGEPEIAAGKDGDCYMFNGVDDYVEIEGYAGVGGSNARTVAAWIKLDEDLGNNDNAMYSIVSWGQGIVNSYKKWMMIIDESTGKLALAIYGARLKGGPDLEDGLWHHVAIVHPEDADNINQVKMYIDGVEVATNADSLNAVINTATTENVLIGALDTDAADDVQDPSRFFKGAIDEVRIYNAALSDEEIAELAE